ncbi:MAG: DUF2117 domain-containing protein [Halobacteriota archaeon]|nr:DUF2117 domain-containing protein [Halobacteriota archaeon]
MDRKKIGVVVHGPEIIDSGWAEEIIDLLETKGDVKAKLGGTMGRTAVIDASLENRIDITERLRPSESVRKLSEEVDELYLLNYGKSKETGHAFGRLVMFHVGRLEIPLVQIERPGDTDGTILPWTEGSRKLALEMAEDLGISVVPPPKIEESVKRSDGKIYRRLSGVYPDEVILINGVVIGKANSEYVEIVSENNRICEINGGVVKEHGIEKLGDVDLESAIIKTGILRRTKRRPRVLEKEKSGKAVIIDHCAESTFEIAKGADIAVTIGDDTTDIAGDLMYRFGIPIIGITDGDIDKIVPDTHIAPGSIIVQLKEGYDDEIGRRIKREIFEDRDTIDIEDVSDLKDRVLKIARDKIDEVRSY